MVAKDEYVIVLDFLPHGKPGDRKIEPLAQVLGERFFNLLEIVTKDEIKLKPKDRVYIGADKREEVKYIRSRVEYGVLTNFAKTELEDVVKEVIEKDETRFVNFFNRAGPITTRLHSLELMPGVGKKHMWEIIKNRKRKPFENFTDLRTRVPMLPEPRKMIVKRVVEELEGKDRYRLFVGSSML
jgi:putative nucleotide binding protein